MGDYLDHNEEDQRYICWPCAAIWNHSSYKEAVKVKKKSYQSSGMAKERYDREYKQLLKKMVENDKKEFLAGPRPVDLGKL